MKVILAGGGSGGPVSPLIAVASELRKLKPKTEFLFVGTKNGPEKQMVAEVGINFVSIPAAKWRRYFAWQNFLAPLVFCAGFLRSFSIIKQFNPDVIFCAGGFVGV